MSLVGKELKNNFMRPLEVLGRVVIVFSAICIFLEYGFANTLYSHYILLFLFQAFYANICFIH